MNWRLWPLVICLWFGWWAAASAPEPYTLRPEIDEYLNTRSRTYKPVLSEPWNYTLGEEGTVENIEKLRLVIAVFRHGVRSPSRTYNGDMYPFNDTKYWPDGVKQLTKVGKNQLYTLGLKLRRRYDGFLSGDYIPSEVMAKSNPVGRDYMSAACLLAGLFPPLAQHQIWNEKIPWQPIPIFEEPYDFVQITINESVCPKFHREMMKAVNAGNVYTSQYEEMLESLKAKSGMSVDILSDIYEYYDTFNLQLANGYTNLPPWVAEYYPKLRALHSAFMSIFTSATPQQTKLLAGPKIADYAAVLREKSRSGNSGLKIYMEAVHETTLNGLLPAFGFIKPFVVDTSAMFLMEMFESPRPGKYALRLVYYKNSTVDRPEILKMENCNDLCPLKHILRLMDRQTPDNWNEECQNE